MSLFHQPWWLSATTGNKYSEVTIVHDATSVDRLPFVAGRNAGFQLIKMPSFTHTLGPLIADSGGKYQTRLANRLSATRSLIDKLPSFDFFKICIDPSCDDGLALADGLAFQDRGFQVSPQYTFRIAQGLSVGSMWDALNFKVRQHIRRTEEKYSLETIWDPDIFVAFYTDNLIKTGYRSNIEFDTFPQLHRECLARECGTVMAAVSPDGRAAAMVFVVWDDDVMYYLLSTRAPDINDRGAVSFLIWSAMKHAHKLGVQFDFDGVSTSGNARFLSGFGGHVPDSTDYHTCTSAL